MKSPPQDSEISHTSLNDALTQRGFQREFRHGNTLWHGRHHERNCTISVRRQSRNRYIGDARIRQYLGYRLSIQLETRVRTQLFFVKKGVASNALVRWIYRLRKQQVIEQLPSVLDGYCAATRDTRWAGKLLAETQAMSAVGRLLNDDDAKTALSGSLYFMPEEVRYGSPILAKDAITLSRVMDTLTRLEQIAQAAEGIEKPQVDIEPSRIARFMQRKPAASGCLVLAGLWVAGLLVFLTLLAGVIQLIR